MEEIEADTLANFAREWLMSSCPLGNNLARISPPILLGVHDRPLPNEGAISARILV